MNKIKLPAGIDTEPCPKCGSCDKMVYRTYGSTFWVFCDCINEPDSGGWESEAFIKVARARTLKQGAEKWNKIVK